MEKKFGIQVNSEFKFQFSEEDLTLTDLQETINNQFHIIDQNKTAEAAIIQSDFNQKTYTIAINSNRYRVEIATPLDMLIESMGLSKGTSPMVNVVKAPMPGLLLDILVQPGDEVQPGDALLILEAMKMENTLTAPASGKVKVVAIAKGDTVDKGQLLIEME